GRSAFCRSHVTLRAVRAANDRAIDARDTARILGVIRRAVQERLAALWGCTRSAITPAEIRDRLPGSRLSPLLERAHDAARSGRRMSQGELDHWRSGLLGELEALESNS
ncbi:MAG: hypothetical protein ACYSUN_13925, partial [Planctomycetota bacterium]